jgi:hypothetical protein
MAHVREEAQRPSLWRWLFSPLWAKIPLHVAGALLIGGLAIYLYQANQVSLPPPEAPRSESLGAARELPAQEPESKIVGAVTKPDEKRTTGNRLERAAQSEDQQVAGAGQFQDAPQERSAQVQRLDETMSAAAKSATAPEMTGVLKIPKPTADYELTLALKETPQETFNLKLHELIKRLNGQIIETAEPVKTAWLIIPAGRYDQFKRELASFSAIESEAQITAPPASAGAKQAPPAAAMSPEPRPLRIKLTVRPPQ